MASKSKTEVISLRLTGDQLREVKRLALDIGKQPADVIRQCIKAKLLIALDE